MALLHFVLWTPFLAFRSGPSIRSHAAVVARLWLQHLGATLIKVGQILSTRPDILPPYVIDQLTLLQDQIPSASYDAIAGVITAELGQSPDAIFSEFAREPVASASVAQVHRAVLKSGAVVAVKVRRPGVAEQATFDEAIMVMAVRVFALIPTVEALSPVETVHEFCAAVRLQLDFRREADNNREFRTNFAGSDTIFFPSLHDDLCTESVLVMEFVDGVKDSGLDQLDLDRKRLAKIGGEAILKMVYTDGFVHADLHPGNILFQPDHRVTFIDLGMVGRIDPQRRNALAGMIMALARGDGRTVARYMYEGSPRKQVKDYGAYEAAVVELVRETSQKTVAEMEHAVFIAQVMEVLRRHRLQADAAFTTINIAMIVVEGLGKKLDPDLDLFTFIQPYLFRVLAAAPAEFRVVVTDSTPHPVQPVVPG